MLDLPIEYLNNMRKLLKDDYDKYLDSFNNSSVHGLRVNTSKISVEDFLKISPFKLEQVPWCSDGFYYDENDQPSKHPYYYAGLYYLQEPSAMLPAEVLPIFKGDKVLDACAAPGGKSLKLANKLNNTGVLFSNDISVTRAQVLLKTLENGGIANSFVMAQDISKLDNFNNYFDKILVDAPCSGEGMFRKDSSLIKAWLDKNEDYYPNIQKEILSKAITMLKQGGQLVYSTCTFNPKEDEEVIEYILDKFTSLKLLPINKYDGFSNGISDKTKNCVRLYPHKVKGEGHFVALLQLGDDTKQTNIVSSNYKHIDNAFINTLNKEFNNGEFISRDNKLFFEPNVDINLKGLRILRSGLFLGEINHQKFEPSLALALNLKQNEYPKIINLSLDDNRVLKYLKCETLDVKDFNVEGYALVCVNNYPLGFGKVNNGILKNKYPANYRYK